jgi:hypothetical protein
MFPRIAPLLVIAVVTWPLSARALDLDPIPPDRPWLIFRAPDPGAGDALAYADQLKQGWKSMPETLRPMAALEIGGPRTGEPGWGDRFHDVVNELQFGDVPAVVSITDSPATAAPIDEIRKLFDQFTIVRGVGVSGLDFGEYPAFAAGDSLDAPPQAAWLASVIELAAQYGRRVILELDGLDWVRLMANTRNRRVYDAMRAHPAVVVPMNSQRGPHSVAATSAVMGLWLEGAAAQWGLACDSSWYADSGFIEPGKFGPTPDAAMPPALYRAMLLNGAMAGATVYRFPRAADLWPGLRKQYWDEAIEPTLRELVEKGYIARKDLVKEKAHVSYRLNAAASPGEFEADLADLDPMYHEGRMLHGAYGLELPGQVPELILNTGRFYWVPVLSPYATDEALASFKEVVLPGALLNASAWRERLEGQYKPDGEGRAFISRIGRAFFVMHTRENFYEEQPYALAAVPAAVRGVTARRGPQGTELTWPFREGDVFYRVYRRVLPSTLWEAVSGDIDAHTYLDAAPPDPAQTVAYGVTALTSETEPLQGAVNYGDYLVINAVESRIVEEAVFEPNTNATTSVPPPPRTESRPASQTWWPEIEDLSGDPLTAAQAVVAQIESLDAAFRKGDAAATAAVYSPSYADANGWGADYVRAAYGLFFKLFRPGPVHRQIRAWDFSALGADGRVSVRLYFRMTGQRRVPESNGAPGPELVLPPSSSGEVDFTFVKSGEQWLLTHTAPALPRLEDFFPGAGASN